MSVPKHIVALIDAKNEEILRLEREKAESEHALGFAVEAVERLEAESDCLKNEISRLKESLLLYDRASHAVDEMFKKLKTENEKMVDVLESIHLYGSDTLSGRVDGDDNREWQREAVKEMTRRAGATIGREDE